MLAKEDRLKDRHKFNVAFKKKQVLRSDLLSIYYLYDKKNLNEKISSPKIGFVVSTKIDKRATARNLIKRRLREAFKLLKKPIILSKNESLVYSVSVLILIVNPKISSASYIDIKNNLKTLLNKLELRGLDNNNFKKNNFNERKPKS